LLQVLLTHPDCAFDTIVPLWTREGVRESLQKIV